MSSNIKVVCRFRPVNRIELANGQIEPIVRFEDVDTVNLEVRPTYEENELLQY